MRLARMNVSILPAPVFMAAGTLEDRAYEADMSHSSADEHPRPPQASHPDTDAALLDQAARHRPGALELLANKYEAVMLGVARGLVGGRTDAAVDVVQDAWVKAIRFAGSYRGTGTVRGWLIRLTVNAARDRLRRERKRRSAHVSWRLTGMHHEEEQIEDRWWEAHDALGRALGMLDATDREIVLLCHCRSLTHAEAAEAIGLPIGTLKTRLYRTMGELRVSLGGSDATEVHA